MKYKKIWESDSYKAAIYEDCTTRVYRHTDKDIIKIEEDGTRWTGNTGGFCIEEYYIKSDADIKKIETMIQAYDEDETSSNDVLMVVRDMIASYAWHG